jgi:hypothetical protein
VVRAGGAVVTIAEFDVLALDPHGAAAVPGRRLGRPPLARLTTSPPLDERVLIDFDIRFHHRRAPEPPAKSCCKFAARRIGIRREHEGRSGTTNEAQASVLTTESRNV